MAKVITWIFHSSHVYDDLMTNSNNVHYHIWLNLEEAIDLSKDFKNVGIDCKLFGIQFFNNGENWTFWNNASNVQILIRPPFQGL
jgi:hypothetical protein